MNLQCKPSRIDFDSIDLNLISRILKTGNVDDLAPEERVYYDMMELVRGLNARMMLPGGKRIASKAGIIKLLKSEVYGLSDWMARRVYADAINFFHAEDGIRPKAWANLYAERLDKLAALAVSMGKLKEARGYYVEAAKLRGCYENQQTEIPKELLDVAPVVLYTPDAEQVGAPKANRKELEAFIDSIPEIPEMTRRRVKEDAGIEPRDIMARMMSDMKEFGDEDD